MGRPKEPPDNPIARLVEEYWGPRTDREVQEMIYKNLGIDRSITAISFARRGKAGPSADYNHRGLRGAKRGDVPTLLLIAKVLGIPDDRMAEAIGQAAQTAWYGKKDERPPESGVIGYYQGFPSDLPFRKVKVA